MSLTVFSPTLGDVAIAPTWPNAGAPTSGTSGTLAGIAQKGDSLVDTTNGVSYLNTGTQASPTWTRTVVNGSAMAITGVTSGAAAAAGIVGEMQSGVVLGTGTTATITVTIAAPGVVTWTAHGFSAVVPQPVVFTTTGALPTGITASTVYWTVPSTVTTNTFQIATTVANAITGTAITTTGTQSGTQTGTAGTAMASTTAINVTGIALSAGDWDVWAQVVWNAGSGTTTTVLKASISQTSATMNGPGTVAGGSEKDWLGTTQTITAGAPTLEVPQCQVDVAVATNVFLVVQATFATSTLGAYGFIAARRRR